MKKLYIIKEFMKNKINRKKRKPPFLLIFISSEFTQISCISSLSLLILQPQFWFSKHPAIFWGKERLSTRQITNHLFVNILSLLLYFQTFLIGDQRHCRSPRESLTIAGRRSKRKTSTTGLITPAEEEKKRGRAISPEAPQKRGRRRGGRGKTEE